MNRVDFEVKLSLFCSQKNTVRRKAKFKPDLTLRLPTFDNISQ
jgi:hypothetical protein